jgi:uncharacterized membrane protein
MIPSPTEVGIEETIVNSVLWLKLAVEAIGVLAAGYQFVKAFVPSAVRDYNGIRLTLARYLAMALEFELGADILATAVAPSWNQIGKLGAIAVIRTALNYFLLQEIREQREGVADTLASDNGPE